MGYCVYKHTAPNGKVYIGITGSNPLKRWRNGNGYYQNEHFSKAIALYGWDRIQHQIIAENLTKEEACDLERHLIQTYKSNLREYGYNNSTGGEFPCSGAKFTEEAKMRQSLAHKSYRPSAETKQKISAAKKGKPNGKQGLLGKLSGNAKIVLQIDEETGEVKRMFYGYAEAVRETGYSKTPIREAAVGIRKRAYGYKWAVMERGGEDVTL